MPICQGTGIGLLSQGLPQRSEGTAAGMKSVAKRPAAGGESCKAGFFFMEGIGIHSRNYGKNHGFHYNSPDNSLLSIDSPPASSTAGFVN
jgi:hypothetical protein